MGELSQSIGKKLENFGGKLFENLEWEILAQNLQLDCTRTSHKSLTSDSGKKNTHGIDILQGYYNTFTKRKEASIVECKHHLWRDFIPSNLNKWVEELVNTIECASSSPTVSPYLTDYTLTSGILLFNSSDNLYEPKRALETLSKVIVPRRRNPIMIYVADTNRLEKWYSLNKEITSIKNSNKDHNFAIIYPSIGGSSWERTSVITPSYLFSDYILSSYTKTINVQDGTRMIDVKSIFNFDKVSEDSFLYLCDMINALQLEARSERKQEIHIYFYPETIDEISFIKECFVRMIGDDKPTFQIKFLDNRRLSPVSYE